MNNAKENFLLPWREGIKGREYFLTFALSLTLSRQGRGDFIIFIS
jgi:hypothetical protein